MANKLTDMSKIRKAIKFHCGGKSKLFISQYLSLSRNTVKKYISLFEVQGLTLDQINQKTDLELETLFSHQTDEPISARVQKLYDFFPVHGTGTQKSWCYLLWDVGRIHQKAS